MTARMMIVPGSSPSRDANGRALPAKLRFYLPDSGGVLTSVYTSSALTTAHSQPISSDADGYFPEIWADSANSFDVGVTRQDTDAPIITYEDLQPLSGDIADYVVAGAASATGAAASAAAAAAAAAAITSATSKTANFTAFAGHRYLLDSTSGVFTATLPASPAAGDTVWLEDNAGQCSTNAVAIGRNSQTINGVAANDSFNLAYAAARYTFSGSTWLSRRY